MKPTLISTKNLHVVLAKHNKLERVTTKIDHASIKEKKQKEKSMESKESKLISTHNVLDVESAKEKKERDTIIAERKNLKKDGPVYLDDNGILVASEKEQKHVENHMKNIEGKVLKTTEDMNLEMKKVREDKANKEGG